MTFVHADPLLDASTVWAATKFGSPGSLERDWPGLVLLESGRVALWAALRALQMGPGDRLVVPAYICDSILPAPAALGVQVRYVQTTSDLKLDTKNLARELALGARAVLIVHYFGFKAPNLDEVAATCDHYGAALIEDCAHVLPAQTRSGPWGRMGAAAILSLWKWLPLPDGGALILNGPLPLPDLGGTPRPAALETARRLAYRWISVVETAFGRSPRLWLLRLGGLRSAMQTRAAQAPLAPRRCSRVAEAMIARADWQFIVARRRQNYSDLDAAVSKLSWAAPLFPALPADTCPLGYPLLATDREWARGRLLSAGVNVRAYWEQLPTAVRSGQYEAANYLSDHILVLPVHQSLKPSQLRHMTRTLATMGTD